MPVQDLAYLLVLPPDGTDLAGDARRTAAAARCAGAAAAPVNAARYTRSLLRQTLQLMGAKPRQSDKVAQKVFLILQQRAALPPSQALSLAECLRPTSSGRAGVVLARPEFDELVMDCLASSDQHYADQLQAPPQLATSFGAPQALRPPAPALAGAVQQPAGCMHAAVQAAAAAASAAAACDFSIACALREQRASVAVLLCGTSGTGKSTLAALLAARLGISTVVSTDSIRHMMRRCCWVRWLLQTRTDDPRHRPPLLHAHTAAAASHALCSFSSEADDPLLWASTYEAGTHFQAAAGAVPSFPTSTLSMSQLSQARRAHAQLLGPAGCSSGDPRKATIQGYKAQSARVLEHVDRLLAGCEARRQSVVLEGAHLSLRCVRACVDCAAAPELSTHVLPCWCSMVVRMMQRHASIVPFLVHISNEAKHMERFAVRSKVMTLRPDGATLRRAHRFLDWPSPASGPSSARCCRCNPAAGNRYVKHFRNIRTIQEYLVRSGAFVGRGAAEARPGWCRCAGYSRCRSGKIRLHEEPVTAPGRPLR